eukprot:jgi/Bigna1/83218/fgenesh1_pg.104_\
MSALRKLRKGLMEKKLLEQAAAADREEEEMDMSEQNQDNGFGALASNAFAFPVNPAVAQDDNDGEEKEGGGVEGEEGESTYAVPVTKSKKKKKKKKKKKEAKLQETTANNVEEEDIDAILAEIMGGGGKKKSKKKKKANHGNVGRDGSDLEMSSSDSPSILSLQLQQFDWRGELTRMFGKKAVKGGSANARKKQPQRGYQRRGAKKGGGGLAKKRTIASRYQDEWKAAAFARGGGGGAVNMVLKHTSQGKSYFTFCYDLQYASTEREFQACKNTLDPRAMAVFHHHNPFHAGGEFKLAAELIERAVFFYEKGYHPKYDPIGRTGAVRLLNQRLNIRPFSLNDLRAEDREFLKALRRHMQCVARRGCVRAALEVCKYALSLTAEAVKALVEEIDTKIVQTDTRWEFITKWPSSTASPFVNKLIRIFAARCSALWRAPPILAWLRDTAKKIDEEGKKKKKEDKRRKKKKEAISEGVGEEGKGHEDAEGDAEDDERNSKCIYGLSPTISDAPAASGARLQQQPPPMQGEGSPIAGNPLAMFFMSMLPNFDPEVAAEHAAAIEVALAAADEDDGKLADAADRKEQEEKEEE